MPDSLAERAAMFPDTRARPAESATMAESSPEAIPASVA
jgi:hypothetical protein